MSTKYYDVYIWKSDIRHDSYDYLATTELGNLPMLFNVHHDVLPRVEREAPTEAGCVLHFNGRKVVGNGEGLIVFKSTIAK